MERVGERLFFALLPPAAAQAVLARVAADLRAAQVLRGRWLDPAKYHVTLPFLGTFERVPDALAAAATAAASAVTAAPFELEFDRLDSFGRRRGAPCVLRPAAGCVTPLTALFDALAAALAAADIAHESARAYVPHLTLAYGELAAPYALDAPLGWTVREFALMHSRVAQGVHTTLARWPLAAA